MGVPPGRVARLLAVPAVGLALVAGVLPLGMGRASAATSPFVIVIDTGVTGPYGANGTAAVEGTKAAAKVLDRTQGGILGHEVVVDVLDNQGNPTTAASLLQQRLSSSPRPDMIVPGSISTEGVAEVPIANQAKILSIGTPNDASLNDPSKYPYEFLVAPSARLPSTELMSYLKKHHLERVAMIHSTDTYGTSVEKATVRAAREAGVTLSTASYDDTDLDVTSQLQKLRSGHPQALFVQGFGPPVGIILQDRYKLGWNVPTIGDLTTATTPLIWNGANKPDEKGLMVQALPIDVYAKHAGRAERDYVKAMKSFGPIQTVLTTSSYQYDSVMLAAQAATQAHSIATPAMAKALEHLRQPTHPRWVTLETYKYRPKDHAPTTSPSNWVIVPASPLTNGQYDGPRS